MILRIVRLSSAELKTFVSFSSDTACAMRVSPETLRFPQFTQRSAASLEYSPAGCGGENGLHAIIESNSMRWFLWLAF